MPRIPPRNWREFIPLEHRLWLKVYERGDCWEWRGTQQGTGYGQFRKPKSVKLMTAHRAAYEVAYGPVPKGLQIHHLCQHKWCVRPSHLLAVTFAEHRALEPKGRQTHCIHGHAFDEKNTYWQKPLPDGRTNGLRACRKCHAIQESRRNARLRAARSSR